MLTRHTSRRIVLSGALALGLLPLVMGSGCPLFPLVAGAGPDAAIKVGESVTLQGSASGGTPGYTYAWSPTTGLSDAAAAQPTFTPTTVGDKVITLTVTDSVGNTATDSVTITVTTDKPAVVADAGPDRTAALGLPVTLQGTASGGNGTYTYAWSPTTGLSSATAAQPTFTPTGLGTFTFTLTVTDGEGVADSDTVDVLVSPATGLSSLTWGTNFTTGGYQVLAVFNQDLDETSAETAANYRITGTSTAPTSATLAADKRTVTLVFEAPLAITSGIDLSVGGGILDTNGNSVAALTAQVPADNVSDTGTPTLSSATWGPNFSAGYQVLFVFNEALDRTSAETTAAYRVSGTATTAASATLGADGKTVTVVFTNVALSSSSTIDVSVSGAIKDINGNAVAQALSRSVSSNAADTSAPAVVAVTHAANFTGTGYDITVEFSEALNKTTAETTTAYRINGTATTASSATLGTDGRTVTVNFQVALAIATTIDISVGDTVKDINGRTVTAQTNVAVLAAAETTAPTVSTRTWAANFAGTGYQILVVFNESMDRATVQTTANWRITSGATAPSTVVLGTDGRTATLTFAVALATTDTIDISVGSTIKDINGNVLAAATNQSVTANGNDTTAPTVSTIEWGVDFAGPGYRVEVTFSESMNKTTAETPANYAVGAGNTAPSAASLSLDGKTLLLTFTGIAGGLASTDVLDVSVGSDVTDINGRAVSEALNQAIAANADDATAPTIVSVTETSAGNIRVVFSEVLDNSTIAAGDFTDVKDGGGVKDAAANIVTLNVDGKTVDITHDGDVDTGNNASIDVANIDDANGNTLVGVDDQAVAP